MPALVELGDIAYEASSLLLAAGAAVVSYVAYRYSRRKDSADAMMIAVKQAIADAVLPVKAKLGELEQEFRRLARGGEAAGKLATLVDGLRRDMDSLAGLVPRVSVLESKIEVFWRNVAYDAAKILHSPHPERAELDSLLEQLDADEITAEGSERLQVMLREVMHQPAIISDKVAALILRVLKGAEQPGREIDEERA